MFAVSFFKTHRRQEHGFACVRISDPKVLDGFPLFSPPNLLSTMILKFRKIGSHVVVGLLEQNKASKDL
jgi:hypothetical protein